MDAISKSFAVYVCGFEELDEQEQALLLVAAGARMHAQAPYSHYLVGAAVLNQDGHVTAGCNVERCSYSETTHAEQSAIDSMVSHEGSNKIKSIAIVSGIEGSFDQWIDKMPKGKAINNIRSIPCPCGRCLQIIWENCMGDDEVRLYSFKDGWVYITTIGEAFPMRFGPDSLGVNL